MIKKYIKIFIFYSIICILIGCLQKVYSEENKYTISGDYTYSEVLNALGTKTKRSVLGSSEALNLKRRFDIYDKKFSTAIDHINKNLFTDGYILYSDTSCFYIKSLSLQDTNINKNNSEIYQVYLPYSKRYIVTKEKEVYLNALQKDKENYIYDSINNEYNNRYYKIVFEVLGFTDEKKISKGLDVGDKIGIKISKDIIDAIKDLNINFSYENIKQSSVYNFYKNIETYTDKDTSYLFFGNEVRRVNSQITNDKVVSNNYESVMEGITLKINKKHYNMIYKTASDQINIMGISDSLLICQYKINDNVYNNKYRYINNYRNSSKIFYMFVKVKKEMLDK